MKIGVLALQGAFIEHKKKLEALGAEVIEVRLPQDLKDLDGLIIPGGESTTIGKLAVEYGLVEPLKTFAREKPVWGTCAGMIFMARDIGLQQPEGLNGEGPFPAVFIRAPLIAGVDDQDVQVLARLEDGSAVAARQGHWLVTSFHPELSDDDRLHRYFLDLIASET
jgi:5'-phosphate synthase pdxT subunit